MPAVHGDLASMVMPADQELLPDIYPRQVTLRDRVTVATLVPFMSPDDVPPSLLGYLSDQLNSEIEKGDTYAMIDPIPYNEFKHYWFSNFGAIMLLGDIKNTQDVKAMDRPGMNWPKICLGSFTVRPNYPGRSSHICNSMFLVTDASRNRGVGRLMGEGYLEWAPKLVSTNCTDEFLCERSGYTYAMFNIVYESNVASCRLWDSLGFKRIGRIPGGGRLASNPGQYVDAIIYGRDLGPEGEDSVTQDRFDKIRYYLKHSKYPRGADRAEKSRLRSAATHYKLVGGQDGETEKLMLKDKEVVSDPQQQYDIAREMHVQQHAGINKTTAAIAVKYHWVRIKETVSRVIRDCPQCKETLKSPLVNGLFKNEDMPEEEDQTSSRESEPSMPTSENMGANSLMDHVSLDAHQSQNPFVTTHPSVVPGSVDSISDYVMPLDPQIIDIHQQLPRFQTHDAMTDPYTHGPHGLSSSHFDDDVRHHAASDYHMMVDDPSDPDPGSALHQDALGLVHSQVSDVHHHEQILAKYQYVGQPDDDLDFT
ncbi:histone acetyltransferase Spt10 [Aspergillus nomiae NRRL 13137]|uniref:Histone acetyltransferase Spt10 n=1 Tax=Aspergillus nomiae NRRL (strain ATCC 15546 / NRRL 13137 / CBS 260.88 / M93) TaxID=1509407 RepID=A0A0L1IXW3_ASPN3|nr:histone acetyltransferase Spt10 [Aspergillus nomiae NRRL 13137]KNG84396.1 histone acetyltransferase Spt10 [Aspergillus nomiae NRRL 13137]